VNTKLLLVEDDRSLGATLTERLEREGYCIRWADTLKKARENMASFFPDLIILDVGLPDGSGFDFAKELSHHTKKPPFLFLTALAGAPERLKGFELGAEEYIPKPFHLKELLLRVKHVLDAHRHIHEVIIENKKFVYKGYTIDFDSFCIYDKEKQATRVSARDMNLLKFLITERHRVVSRDEILDKLWGEDNFPTNRTIDNSIVRLRQSFGEHGSEAIQSIRGVGYRWIGE
jgi:DNA-binding response OmpR family regulator